MDELEKEEVRFSAQCQTEIIDIAKLLIESFFSVVGLSFDYLALNVLGKRFTKIILNFNLIFR